MPPRIKPIDLFVVYPLTLWGGYRLAKESPTLGPWLTAFGAATMVYSVRNYMQARNGGS